MSNFKPLSFLAIVALWTFSQGAAAVGLANVPNAHHNPHHNLGPDGGTLGDALKQGKVDLWLRWRLEDVEDDIPSGSPIANADKANLLSMRIQAGFTTARWHGFYLRAEGEFATRLSGDNAFNVDSDLTFPPGPVGSRAAEGHAIIPDSNFAEWNEAFIGWRSGTSTDCGFIPGPCDGKFSAKLGRQTIIYDNHRWVGDVIWRNNNVSFDALRVDATPFKNFGISYSHLKQANRLFGDKSPFDEWRFESAHLLNASYTFPLGKLVGYAYFLDFDDNRQTPFPEGTGALPTGVVPPPNAPPTFIFDHEVIGARFFGKYEINDRLDLLYDVEWANQDPSDDAVDSAPPGMRELDDNDYTNFELGLRFGGQRVMGLGLMPIGEPTFQFKVGMETLEGNGVNALQTPLATVHAFNGWADKFVGAPGGSQTPADGLEDISAELTILGLFGNYIGKNKIVVRYHDFESDRGSTDYGDEWNLLWGKPDFLGQKNLLGAIKYADFNDGNDGFSFDTEKFWLLLQYRFK